MNTHSLNPQTQLKNAASKCNALGLSTDFVYGSGEQVTGVVGVTVTYPGSDWRAVISVLRILTGEFIIVNDCYYKSVTVTSLSDMADFLKSTV